MNTMPTSRRLLRSVKDIRTRSGSSNNGVVPDYKVYMTVTALEMERARRQTERGNLLERLKGIEARLAAIGSEKAALLRGLRERPRRQALVVTPAPRHINTPPRTLGGFKIRY